VPRATLLGLVRPTTRRRSDILEAEPGPWTLDLGETEELPVTTPSPSEVRSVLLDLVRRRGSGKTVCPSEAARALAAEGWRDLMEDVRQEAYRMADAGLVDITQQGRVVDGRTARGPIRVRLR
jgi:hypothetical protein